MKLPDPLARRHLLEGRIAPEKARGVAEAYLAEGREVEAIDFLARAEAHERLESLRSAALEAADVFLFRAASSALGSETPAEVWSRLAEVARAAG